jgi:hypothetical protein
MARRTIDESRTASMRQSYGFWKATMARTLVDYEKLKAIANEEISSIPECAGYEVGIVAHLPDETGCNWDIKVTRRPRLTRVDRAVLRGRCAMQDESNREVERLIAELEQAEAFEQKLRQYIIDAKDQLAAGKTSVALSLLNDAISYIDSAPDVVTGSEHRP